MEFKFIGNPNDASDNKGAVSFYGIIFPLNVPVKVEDPTAIKKLMGNNHFAVVDGGKTYHQNPAPKLILPKPVEEGAVVTAPKTKRARRPATLEA